MSRQAKKIASRWVHYKIAIEWQPPIPPEAILRAFGERQAYVPDTQSLISLDEARDSVGVFIPKIQELLKKKQGDRYYVNASENRGRIFYFFSPPQPIDTFNMTLAMRGNKTHLSFGYTPYKLDGSPDFKKMITKQVLTEPDVAGLAMMRLVRATLAEI